MHNTHILQVELIIRLGQDNILRAALFTEILYEDQLGMKIEDSRSSEH